jgi:hypothetical protein
MRFTSRLVLYAYLITYLAYGLFYLYNKCDITFLTVFILTDQLCRLSLWEETGAPGENPRLSVER